jgi:hypothetical protein
MNNKENLQEWVLEALIDLNGIGRIVDVAKHIWEHHENDLKSSEDMFYTWQYDMRWAATRLRESKKILPVEKSQKGEWRLT